MNCICKVKGSNPMVARLNEVAKNVWLSRQSNRVQQWAKRYESDKLGQKQELADIGKAVTNAMVKFASKSQRRVLTIKPKAESMKAQVVRVRVKAERRLKVNTESDGLEIFRYRWRKIKDIIWSMGWNNTFIPSWYKYFGDFNSMKDDKVIARDIIYMKQFAYEMECLNG